MKFRLVSLCIYDSKYEIKFMEYNEKDEVKANLFALSLSLIY